VGVNAELLDAAEVGLPAGSASAWKDALLGLAADPEARRAMGRRGRELVERDYSLRTLAPRLANILVRVAAGGDA
jgi:glycosyltransferase involved in cell wall biosynthesis